MPRARSKRRDRGQGKKQTQAASGFKAIRYRLPGMKAVRFMYAKQHRVGQQQASSSSSSSSDDEESTAIAFVINIDPEMTEEDVAMVFEEAGGVKSVVLSALVDNTGKLEAVHAAHVAFDNARSLGRALNLGFVDLSDAEGRGEGTGRGVAQWVSEHQALRPKVDVMEAQVEAVIAAYDERKEAEEAARLARLNATDDDGWTVVTRGGRKNRVRGADGVVVGVGAADGRRRHKHHRSRKSKKKSKIVLDFYRFQRKAKRKEEIAELREKFAQDKQKIAEMRASNKFRPF